MITILNIEGQVKEETSVITEVFITLNTVTVIGIRKRTRTMCCVFTIVLIYYSTLSPRWSQVRGTYLPKGCKITE